VDFFDDGDFERVCNLSRSPPPAFKFLPGDFDLERLDAGEPEMDKSISELFASVSTRGFTFEKLEIFFGKKLHIYIFFFYVILWFV